MENKQKEPKEQKINTLSPYISEELQKVIIDDLLKRKLDINDVQIDSITLIGRGEKYVVNFKYRRKY